MTTIIERLGDQLNALDTKLSADVSSLSTRVGALEARQQAEGRAIVEIIRLISPSFSEDDQEKFDDIITEMERPLHESGAALK